MDKVRIAMIGAGGMANAVHYPSLAEMDDVEFAGICDLDPGRLAQTADQYGIDARFSDYRKMIEQTAPDAVYAIMPPHHVFDVAAWCLQQKQDLFIEKPPAVNALQTRSLAAWAEQSGAKTMVAFNRRFIPILVRAKELVSERGDIIQCQATFMKNHLGGGPYYGGAIDILSCDAVHAVDTLRWMGGEVASVASVVASYHLPFPGAFNAVMRFESGATGILQTNWSVGKRVHTFELHSKGISAFVDGNGEARIYADNSDEATVLVNTEVAGSTEFAHYYGYFAENRHFVDCLKSGACPMPDLADAAKTMELVERIYASAI